jgi:hypothetical protein
MLEMLVEACEGDDKSSSVSNKRSSCAKHSSFPLFCSIASVTHSLSTENKEYSMQYADFQEAQEALSPNQAELLVLEVM